MKPVARVGPDIAKSVFQLHAVDVHSKIVYRKTLLRSEMFPFFANLPPCLVGIEAYAGSPY